MRNSKSLFFFSFSRIHSVKKDGVKKETELKKHGKVCAEAVVAFNLFYIYSRRKQERLKAGASLHFDNKCPLVRFVFGFNFSLALLTCGLI